MEWLLLALLGSGGAWATRRWVDRAARRRLASEELAEVRRAAEEDVTVLGEQLTALDLELGDRGDRADVLAHHGVALDEYERAQRVLAHAGDLDAVVAVVVPLGRARHALACARARAAGETLPRRRTACFFDPRHGPSVTDVEWTPPGCGTRIVPACAQDAARIRARQSPAPTTVRIGSRQVPYWEAGRAASRYGGGDFPLGETGLGPTLAWVFTP